MRHQAVHAARANHGQPDRAVLTRRAGQPSHPSTSTPQAWSSAAGGGANAILGVPSGLGNAATVRLLQGGARSPSMALALQRTIGNAATRQHLAHPLGSGAAAPVAQRQVTYTLRGAAKPVTSVRDLVARVRGYWTQYADVQPDRFPNFQTVLPSLTDRVIEDVTQGYLTDATPRTVASVAEEVFRTARQRLFDRRTVLDAAPVLPGVKAVVLAATANTAGLRPRTRLPSSTVDLHAPDITFEAVVGVQGSAAALNGWQVGVTQTVLHVDRRFAFRVLAAGSTWVQESTTQLGAPANDRNPGIAPPWYNSHVDLGAAPGRHAITLHDKPGEELNFGPRGTADGMQRTGTDRFGTWIILWHPATQQARFLGGWSWTVDYGDEAGSRTQVSAFRSLTDTGAPPAEALLGGSRCAEVLTSTMPNPRPLTPADALAFGQAEASDRTRQAYTQAARDFATALAGKNEGALRTERDKLVAAWSALAAGERTNREGDLLRRLGEYEQRVNRRLPSQDALRSQYNLR